MCDLANGLCDTKRQKGRSMAQSIFMFTLEKTFLTQKAKTFKSRHDFAFNYGIEIIKSRSQLNMTFGDYHATF